MASRNLLPRWNIAALKAYGLLSKCWSHAEQPFNIDKPPPCTLHYLATCKHESDCKYGHDYLLKEEHYEEIRKNAKKAPCPSLNKGRILINSKIVIVESHAPRDEECLWGDKCIYGHKCPEGVNCHFRLQGRCRFGGGMSLLSRTSLHFVNWHSCSANARRLSPVSLLPYKSCCTCPRVLLFHLW